MRAISIAVAAVAAAARATGSTPTASVVVNLDASLAIGGVRTLERDRFFNVHSSPGSANWRAQDITQFASNYSASLGRAFVFSSTMAVVSEDPARPGYVDPASLSKHCQQYPLALDGWPEGSVDLIHSSKTSQLYPNGCGDGKPKGFLPGSHNATADFFVRFFEECMMPTKKDRYFIEVANECNVKTSACNTTFDEMIGAHVAVADALHRAGRPAGKAPIVAGPTAAYPAYEVNNFSVFNNVMGAFIRQAGPHMDAISVHVYDTYDGDLHLGSPRSGANLDAILDLQESFSLQQVGRVLPALVSEHGSGFKVKPMRYSPVHDWYVLRGACAHTVQFMARPDRILKAVPFIVAKATWYENTFANASFSYPWVLWRYDNATSDWNETTLPLFYGLWTDFQGDRVAMHSNDANVVGTALVSGTTARVALHNLRNESTTVSLEWQGATGSTAASVTRLRLDATGAAPQLVREAAAPGQPPPRSLAMSAGETAIVEVAGVSPSPGAAVRRAALHSSAVLVSLASSATVPFPQAGCPAGTSLAAAVLRLSVGGDAVTFLRALPSLHVAVGGRTIPVDPSVALAGTPYVNSNDGSFFGAVQLDVPVAALATGDLTATVGFPGGALLTLAAAVMDVDCA